MNQEVEMKLDRSSASQSPLRRLMTLAAIAGIGAATITLAGVVNATPATVNSIILLVGADESQRVVNWYASANTSQLVQVAPTEDLLNGAFPQGAKTFTDDSTQGIVETEDVDFTFTSNDKKTVFVHFMDEINEAGLKIDGKDRGDFICR